MGLVACMTMPEENRKNRQDRRAYKKQRNTDTKRDHRGQVTGDHGQEERHSTHGHVIARTMIELSQLASTADFILLVHHRGGSSVASAGSPRAVPAYSPAYPPAPPSRFPARASLPLQNHRCPKTRRSPRLPPHSVHARSPAERGARATFWARSLRPVGALIGANADAEASAARVTATRIIARVKLMA